ncbi:hypothetical protein JB92DRAFT_2835578 [Gautieria morchelliformis]|nr:hypothetical protein JB92DRAFT_2835578 [Gautieria morchelliformis]
MLLRSQSTTKAPMRLRASVHNTHEVGVSFQELVLGEPGHLGGIDEVKGCTRLVTAPNMSSTYAAARVAVGLPNSVPISSLVTRHQYSRIILWVTRRYRFSGGHYSAEETIEMPERHSTSPPLERLESEQQKRCISKYILDFVLDYSYRAAWIRVLSENHWKGLRRCCEGASVGGAENGRLKGIIAELVEDSC